MSIILTNIQRPSNCGHAVLTVNEDGVTKQFKVYEGDITDGFSDLPYPPKQMLVLLWMKYKKAQGSSWASMINQTIIE